MRGLGLGFRVQLVLPVLECPGPMKSSLLLETTVPRTVLYVGVLYLYVQ